MAHLAAVKWPAHVEHPIVLGEHEEVGRRSDLFQFQRYYLFVRLFSDFVGLLWRHCLFALQEKVQFMLSCRFVALVLY